MLLPSQRIRTPSPSWRSGHVSVSLEPLKPIRTPSPLRQGFQPGGFKLVLVGKDGGVKLEQDAVLAPEELFAVIDRMPMRRNEMRN